MGAWGDGTFQNDSAMDWVGEVMDGGMEVVLETLRSAGNEEVLLRPDWEAQMAAMEVVAALRGHRTAGMNASLAIWCSDHGRVDPADEELAVEIGRSLRVNDDFLELFGEPVGNDMVYPALEDLMARLAEEPKPQDPVTEAMEQEHEELLQPNEEGLVETGVAYQFGAGGKILAESGDVIGIPLDGSRMAVCLLLQASNSDESIGAPPGMPPLSHGVIGMTDAVLAEASSDVSAALEGAKIVAMDRFMLGFLQVGRWPVLASGFDATAIMPADSSPLSAALDALTGEPSDITGPVQLDWFAKAWHRAGPCNLYSGGPRALDVLHYVDKASIPDDLIYIDDESKR